MSFFNGLTAGTLTPGIKAANPIECSAIGGDGDMYGEGGNHLSYSKKPDITNIVYDNMVYGLIKVRRPISFLGFKTPVQVHGVTSVPFNPLAVILFWCHLVARALPVRRNGVSEQAVQHKDMLCLIFFNYAYP